MRAIFPEPGTWTGGMSAASPGGRPIDLSCGHDDLHGSGVKFALGGKDTGSKAVRSVPGTDRHTGLRNDGSGVVGVVSQMHGGPAFTGSTGEHRFVNMPAVHSRSAKRRQQGRVDIQNAIFKFSWNREQVQPARQADEIGFPGSDRIEDSFRMSVTLGHDDDREPRLLGLGDSRDVHSAGDDANKGSRETAFRDSIDEILQRGAAAGNQNSQSGRIDHVF